MGKNKRQAYLEAIQSRYQEADNRGKAAYWMSTITALTV